MNQVEELLTFLMDAAWLDAPKNIREYGQDIVTIALQILLQQYRLPYSQRDHLLIRQKWKLVNEEGRKTELFKGIEASAECKKEFKRFLKNQVH